MPKTRDFKATVDARAQVDHDFAVALLAEKDEELERLLAEVSRYKQWFDDNAANLATHRIGGFSFPDQSDAEVGWTTTVSTLQKSDG